MHIRYSYVHIQSLRALEHTSRYSKPCFKLQESYPESFMSFYQRQGSSQLFWGADNQPQILKSWGIISPKLKKNEKLDFFSQKLEKLDFLVQKTWKIWHLE